jgi:hypothetical protein
VLETHFGREYAVLKAIPRQQWPSQIAEWVRVPSVVVTALGESNSFLDRFVRLRRELSGVWTGNTNIASTSLESSQHGLCLSEFLVK